MSEKTLPDQAQSAAKQTKYALRLRPLPVGAPMKRPMVMLATWGGAGRIMPASGTWGTLAALPFGYLIQFFGGPLALACAALIVAIIGTKAASFYGKKSGEVDDQAIVVDEVAGVWIAAIAAETYIFLWFCAFVLFRIFDITKPWPASYFENRKKGGFDVMMDDIVAGIFAGLGTAACGALYLSQL